MIDATCLRRAIFPDATSIRSLWCRSQLTFAHGAVVVPVDTFYLILKFVISLRQSFDDNICPLRHFRVNRAHKKQPLANLKFVLGHKDQRTKR